MLKKLLIAGLAALMLTPAGILLAVAVLATPAANASCTTAGETVTVVDVPDSLTAVARDGTTLTLNKQQLTHAATIITVAAGIDGVNSAGTTIALMAALTESTLRQLANTGAYPESADYPNDGDGSDHDSLGLFQMRPQAGWGTVADLMEPAYQTAAFFGGPSGPNHPSPRGLLDIPDWQDLDPGQAAQAVEVSAYPDRYQNYEPVAASILTTLTGGTTTAGGCATQTAGFDADTGIAPPARSTDGTWPAESCTTPDPTQPGRAGACVTGRTAMIVAQINAMGAGQSGMFCWDPHEWNPTSDHARGRACDIVFGTLGYYAAGADKTNGDRLAAWMADNADTWAINYVIWQGRIWAGGTWQPYTSSTYDVSTPTGGHYDHVHLSVE